MTSVLFFCKEANYRFSGGTTLPWEFDIDPIIGKILPAG
jgi:hypothetical protein